MKTLSKVRSSALQFAVLISAVTAILLASFLALSRVHSLFGLKSDMLHHAIELSQKGIESSLNDLENEKGTFPIREDTALTVTRGAWGGFIRVTSTASVMGTQFSKQALIGQGQQGDPIAVLVADPQLPLTLVGDTRITGNVMASDRGVAAGVISGRYFSGGEPVRGKILSNGDGLPELDRRWLEENLLLLEGLPFGNERFTELEDKLQNSFFEGPMVIYSREGIRLSQRLTGNIVVKSEKGITVTRNARLTDVLLVAPKVTVEDGFSGNCHLLASEKISVGENSLLSYPSSLTLMEKQGKENGPDLETGAPVSIGKGSKVTGNVIYLDSAKNGNAPEVSLELGKGSLVIGQVYCNGHLELLGGVEGSVFTQRFIHVGGGSRYINHIMDGTVDAPALPKGFCGLPLQNGGKGVAQWLY